jgi:hypothetical protein
MNRLLTNSIILFFVFIGFAREGYSQQCFNPTLTLDAPTSSITTTSILLTWGGEGGLTTYTRNWTAEFKLATASTWTTACTSSGNTPSAKSCTINGLTPGTLYNFQVRLNGGCYIPPPIDDAFTETVLSNMVSTMTKANAPALLPTLLLTSNSFTANWNSSTGASEYLLDVSTDNAFSAFVNNYHDKIVSSTSQSVTGLDQNTTYFFRVRASNSGGASAYSSSSSVLTFPGAPNTGLPTGLSSSGFTANWNSVIGFTSYHLDVSTSENFSDFLPGFQDFLVSSTSKSLTGLTSNTTYYYRVHVSNSTGNSYSSGQTATLPASPTITPASAITATSFIAHWNAIPGITIYLLDLATDNAFANFVEGYHDLVIASSNSKSLSGLSSNTTYYYRMRAQNSSGNSEYSTSSSNLTLPKAPVASAPSAITTTSFKANWNLVEGISSYSIDLSKNVSFETFVGSNRDLAVTANSISLTELTPGDTYYYRIRSVNSSGSSEVSNTVSMQTTASAPIANLPSSITDHSFTINWTMANGAARYAVDVASDVSFNNLLVSNVSTSETSLDIKDLSAGTVYYSRVRSINNFEAISVNSVAQAILTLPSPPELKDGQLSKDKIEVKWEKINTATGYELEVSLMDTFSEFIPTYSPKVISNGSTTNHIIDFLSPATIYYFRMRSRNATGLSEYSATRSIGTLDLGGKDINLKISSTSATTSFDSSNPLPQKLSITTSGGNGTVRAYLYHRPCSTNTPYISEPLVGSNGSFSIDVSQAWLDEFGMQYYFEARDSYNLAKETEGALIKTLVRKINDVEVPLSRFGKDTRNYHIISIPYQLTKERIDELFSFMGKYDDTKWRLLKYDDGKNLDYEEQSLKTSSIIRGQGYWFISKSEVELKFGSGSTYANTIESPFLLLLKKGWNQIGNPFPYTLNWSDVLTENHISPTAMPYLIYDYENKNLKADNSLQVFSGGFVFADNDITLKFPTTLPKQTIGGRMSILESSIGLSDWQIPLEINQGPITNRLSAFGMMDRAKEGKDDFDLVVPPAFFEFLNFASTNNEYEYDLTRDIVPVNENHTWNYMLTGNLKGSVEIKWSEDKVKFVQGHLYLHDLTNHNVIDMSLTSNYNLPSSTASIRIYFSTSRIITEKKISLGQPNPNSFKTKATIPFDFSIDPDFSGEAQLLIYNIQGRKIFETQKSIYGPGVHQIEWDGLDDSGAQVPDGMYLYKLSSRTNKGFQFYQGKVIKQ